MSTSATATPPSLVDLRRKAGETKPLSYYAIAKGTGYHVSYIVRVFNGNRRPSVDCLSSLAAYLGCSMDRLTAALQQVRKA